MQNNPDTNSNGQHDGQHRMEVLQFAEGALRSWRFIVANFVVVTVLALVISMLLPVWYMASVSVLPPKQPDLFGNLSAAGSMLRNLSGIPRLGQKNSAYNFLAVLKSRTAMEAVVRKFDLIRVYQVPDSSMEKATKALEGNVVFDETADDNISINVYDKDPQRAADMANYFVEVLNTVSIDLGTREAHDNRVFIENRLNDSRARLHRNEDSLRAFQERSGVMLTPEQTSSLSGVAALYALKARRELELGVMRRSVSPDHPALHQLEVELEEINKRLSAVPETGITSLRLYRDVAIEQKVLEYLVPLYEQARIEEQKDVPVILVLDKAVRPEYKAKPKRLIIVATAAALSLLVSFFFVIGRLYTGRLAQQRSADLTRLGSLYRDVSQEWRFWRRRSPVQKER